MISDLILLSVAAGFAGVGLLMLATGVRDVRTARRLSRGDPVDVADLDGVDGPVRVEGRVRTDQVAVTAPYSENGCVAYEFEAAERDASGLRSSWETRRTERKVVPFLVADETGRVRVEPQGASLSLASETTTVPPGERPPEHVAELPASTRSIDANERTMDVERVELDPDREQRFTERRLDTDAEVVVYGRSSPADGRSTNADGTDAVVCDGDDVPAFVIAVAGTGRPTWHLLGGPVVRIALAALVLGLALVAGLLGLDVVAVA